MAYTTIDDPSAYFKVQLYTGNGSADRAITFDDTDTDMQPDLVWIKNRDGTNNHILQDAVRGATKSLESDGTGSEVTSSTRVLSFGSDGFSIGSAGTNNTNTDKYVAWCWKESATSGFDIVTYTGTGSAKTESHSLSAVPEFITVKVRSETGHWRAYHGSNTAAPETDALIFNDTDATYDLNTYWNDTAPTSSVFTVGTHDQTNKSTVTYVAYLWRSVQGFSKFGSYSGSGSSDGPFIYTGFRPAWIMCKCNSAGSSEWRIWNNKMDTFNPADNVLDANDDGAEDTSAEDCDFCANGFKWRAGGLKNNDAGETYIYMAFAEAPFVNSNGVPCNAR